MFQMVKRYFHLILRGLGWTAIKMIRFYQLFISPILGPCCRFYPSCSQYMILAIQKYGVIKGILKGIWRIIRCNPWSKGGIDEP